MFIISYTTNIFKVFSTIRKEIIFIINSPKYKDQLNIDTKTKMVIIFRDRMILCTRDAINTLFFIKYDIMMFLYNVWCKETRGPF